MATNNPSTLDGHYGIRANNEAVGAYRSRCETQGRNHQEFTREMMAAFVDGRMKITLTEEQAAAQADLYTPEK